MCTDSCRILHICLHISWGDAREGGPPAKGHGVGGARTARATAAVVGPAGLGPPPEEPGEVLAPGGRPPRWGTGMEGGERDGGMGG